MKAENTTATAATIDSLTQLVNTQQQQITTYQDMVKALQAELAAMRGLLQDQSKHIDKLLTIAAAPTISISGGEVSIDQSEQSHNDGGTYYNAVSK